MLKINKRPKSDDSDDEYGAQNAVNPKVIAAVSISFLSLQNLKYMCAHCADSN